MKNIPIKSSYERYYTEASNEWQTPTKRLGNRALKKHRSGGSACRFYDGNDRKADGSISTQASLLRPW